jgi:hypothetical protein
VNGQAGGKNHLKETKDGLGAPRAEFAHTDLGAFPVDLSGRGNAVHPVAAHAHIAERGGRDQDGDDDQGL